MFDTNIQNTAKTLSLPNETDLLALIADGNEKAFARLYHHYRPKIYSYAFHLFRNVTLADELVQEIFLKVWLNRGKLPELLSFQSWLFIVTRNQVFDTLKLQAREASARQQMEQLQPATAASNLVDDEILSRENEARLRDALDNLSPQQKLIFDLSRQKGLKHEEIATQLNISRNTVKTHLVHALKTLRETMYFHIEVIFIVLAGLSAVC